MLLEAVDIHKTYTQGKKKLDILKGIDLKVEQGEVLCIVGPSGAGKSTLLHILGGLDYPTSGAVNFDGDSFYKNNDKVRAKIRNNKIGFVFQFYHLFPGFTALENVLFPMMVKEDTVGVKKFESKGLDLLDQFGLIERIKHKPNELSGGEQQRVAIARAVINDPQILFCDEPTGNLDSENGSEVIRLLLDLNKRNKQTLIIVTHDEELAELCHRTVHIRDGAIMQS
ncbi:MAG: ABC transporter ATP-binding protein [Candidatus Omnitrophica bacterium]|nr:ABC transporter ATP-binding protein [Candidatus Omnitrophota bacterium]